MRKIEEYAYSPNIYILLIVNNYVKDKKIFEFGRILEILYLNRVLLCLK